MVFVATLLLLAFIAFGQNNTTTFRLNHSLVDIFTNAIDGEETFPNITTPGDFWRWINTHFIDIAFHQQAANSDQVASLRHVFMCQYVRYDTCFRVENVICCLIHFSELILFACLH